ncbi:MAG: hypothetical protein VB144_05120 [Clostridia bacterium]|nr:hypothetical protein [Clostridia bacterium]
MIRFRLTGVNLLLMRRLWARLLGNVALSLAIGYTPLSGVTAPVAIIIAGFAFRSTARDVEAHREEIMEDLGRLHQGDRAAVDRDMEMVRHFSIPAVIVMSLGLVFAGLVWFLTSISTVASWDDYRTQASAATVFLACVMYYLPDAWESRLVPRNAAVPRTWRAVYSWSCVGLILVGLSFLLAARAA